MDKTKLRVGGVPEHFNLPIHQANERGLFGKRDIEIEWTSFRGGTGQMTKALRNHEIDVCVLLTEGIVADIIKGNKSKIISQYVISPLTWGVHTGADNPLDNYKDVYNKKYAISRFGSGSHLMALVDANSKGFTIEKEQFILIQNLEGALSSLVRQESDVFYWEKFTTKPFVDSGQLKRLGTYTTPWPCFMIAATNEIIEKEPEALIRFLRIIHDRCDRFMLKDENIKLVSERYKLKPKDAENWFHSTEWAIHGWVSDKMLKNVVYNLKLANILSADAIVPELVWKRGA